LNNTFGNHFCPRGDSHIKRTGVLVVFGMSYGVQPQKVYSGGFPFKVFSQKLQEIMCCVRIGMFYIKKTISRQNWILVPLIGSLLKFPMKTLSSSYDNPLLG